MVGRVRGFWGSRGHFFFVGTIRHISFHFSFKKLGSFAFTLCFIFFTSNFHFASLHFILFPFFSVVKIKPKKCKSLGKEDFNSKDHFPFPTTSLLLFLFFFLFFFFKKRPLPRQPRPFPKDLLFPSPSSLPPPISPLISPLSFLFLPPFFSLPPHHPPPFPHHGSQSCCGW